MRYNVYSNSCSLQLAQTYTYADPISKLASLSMSSVTGHDAVIVISELVVLTMEGKA
jgi:hypothetical protein